FCLSFISQAEKIFALANKYSDDPPFETFPSKAKRRGINTLNYLVEGKKVTLRPRFNDAAAVIRVNMRRNHPLIYSPCDSRLARLSISNQADFFYDARESCSFFC